MKTYPSPLPPTIIGAFAPAALVGIIAASGLPLGSRPLPPTLVFPALMAIFPAIFLWIGDLGPERNRLRYWVLPLMPFLLGAAFLAPHAFTPRDAVEEVDVYFSLLPGATLCAAGLWGLCFGLLTRSLMIRLEKIERREHEHRQQLKSGEASG